MFTHKLMSERNSSIFQTVERIFELHHSQHLCCVLVISNHEKQIRLVNYAANVC